MEEDNKDLEDFDELQNEDDIVEPSATLLLFNYLQTERGHKIATDIVTLVEEIKKSTLDKNAEQTKLKLQIEDEQMKMKIQTLHSARKFLLISQTVVFVVTVVAASFLTYAGKFDTAIGVLFGTLVGYFFGRKTNTES